MEIDAIPEDWERLKGKIKDRWPNLSETELEVARGQTDMLVGQLQQHYAITREEAQQQVDRFLHEELAAARRG